MDLTNKEISIIKIALTDIKHMLSVRDSGTLSKLIVKLDDMRQPKENLEYLVRELETKLNLLSKVHPVLDMFSRVAEFLDTDNQGLEYLLCSGTLYETLDTEFICDPMSFKTVQEIYEDNGYTHPLPTDIEAQVQSNYRQVLGANPMKDDNGVNVYDQGVGRLIVIETISLF